jgi:hypothetical protein
MEVAHSIEVRPPMTEMSDLLPRARAGGGVGAASCAFLLAAVVAAQAGHEVPYYPSFYPQEIRIEPLAPDAAAREFASTRDPLHVYVGSSPAFGGGTPAQLKSVVSLASFITARVHPTRFASRDARCRMLDRAPEALAKHPDIVVHRHPVTPYHADYIGHVDRLPVAPGLAAAGSTAITVDGDQDSASLAAPNVRVETVDWDLRFAEVRLDALMRAAGTGAAAWPAEPWVKEGWFQAYHLLESASGAAESGARGYAKALYTRLIHREFKDSTERTDLERQLIAALTENCQQGIVGYRLRREFYSDDFSNGVENIAFDAQAGFNSAIFVRTVKLKDLPWNGWLRVGIDTPATAAWNPVAGFTDATGRLVWSVAGDNAFLPIPYNSAWVFNRTEIRPGEDEKPGQSIRVPADALAPQPGTGRMAAVGTGKAAMAKVQYRVSASSFHDGTEMEAADHLYPYALAFRWGGGLQPNGGVHDPAIAAATRLMRERLKGVRIVRVEETVLPIADLKFHYRWPIIEVYLDDASNDEQENALIAPPWSSVPWHVLALMEAAVERRIATFSQGQAERQKLPWLDLVRDPAQLAQLRALIKGFIETGYRPAALADLVTPEAAKARWQALDKFVEAHGHLLVTNGPYQLRSHTPEVTTFDVIREFTYPIGLGTFDSYAHPPRAGIIGIERAGDRILVAADVEIAVKQMRDRRLVRMPLKRDTLRDTLPIRPLARYLIVDAAGKAAAAGQASWERDGRFAVPLSTLPAGRYTAFTGIFADGNTIDPAIGRLAFEKN